MSSFRHFAFLITLAAAVSACDTQKSDLQTPAAQSVGVQVQPDSAQVAPGGSQKFAAAVTGTSVTSVTWSIVEPGNVGTVTTAGMYTAPGVAGTFHVRARSVADTTAFADSTVTVQPPTCSSFTYSAWSACTNGQQSRTVLSSSPAGCTGGSPVLTQACSLPVTVSITPSPTAVDACKTVAFTATVANATNTAVTWAVQEGAAGGTIATNGVYTAPSTAGTYHVVATSVASNTATALATVTVSDHILSIAVNPASTSVTAGGTQQFTATVTTSCGAFVATGP
jgi:hypothetical protein